MPSMKAHLERERKHAEKGIIPVHLTVVIPMLHFYRPVYSIEKLNN